MEEDGGIVAAKVVGKLISSRRTDKSSRNGRYMASC